MSRRAPKPRSARPDAASLRPAPLNDHARDVAIRALARLARAWPDLPADALDVELASREHAGVVLRPVDAAFAQAIYHAAARRWGTLAWLLHGEIRQGFDALEPRLRGVLISGAAQLLLLDRVPAHAVINHGVEWAKQVVRPGAGGLVNAVLRKTAQLRESASTEPGPWDDGPDSIPLASGGCLRFTRSVLPDDPTERLAIATSCPRLLIDHWSRTVGRETTRARALHGLVEPPVILNIQHADPALVANHPALIPHAIAGHAVFTGHGAELSTVLSSLDPARAWVQDPASANAIRSIAHSRPSLIVDLCAGQGTKTRQLAATFPDARILATDVHPARFATLQAAFAGSSQVQVLPMPNLRDAALEQADLIVLDVPCSNTGVLPRRPEARYRFSPATLEELAGVQRQIIADSIPLLAPTREASILFATCSLEPEENTVHAAWANRWHNFVADRQRLDEPAGLPGDPPAGYCDGGYSMHLRRGRGR